MGADCSLVPVVPTTVFEPPRLDAGQCRTVLPGRHAVPLEGMQAVGNCKAAVLCKGVAMLGSAGTEAMVRALCPTTDSSPGAVVFVLDGVGVFGTVR